MGKKRNLTKNDTQNFILRGSNSIQIGIYLLLFVFLLKSLLDGFLSDVSMLGMMSIQIIESTGTLFLGLLVLLSGTALFFSNRRSSRRTGLMIWNKQSKRQFLTYLLLSVVSIALLIFVKNSGYSNWIGPLFLFSLGSILFISNFKRSNPHLLLTVISVVLAILVFLIPSYWYSAILIMGAAFFVYGIMVRK